jgi:dTDP-4-dehydrorhamnose 3,5-epimerase
MKHEKLPLEGLVLITLEVHEDNRGHFFEILRKKDLLELGIGNELVQVNQSYSVKNVIRGLHFQNNPLEQGKLIRVVSGQIMDVAVDIRPESGTYLKWKSVILSSEKPQLFWIPRGFAHGFKVQSEYAIVEYHCDEYFNAAYDSGILYYDRDINIDWCISQPIVSEKDNRLLTARELLPGV